MNLNEGDIIEIMWTYTYRFVPDYTAEIFCFTVLVTGLLLSCVILPKISEFLGWSLEADKK